MMLLDAAPGDWLVMMTDGFPEAVNSAGETLGEEGVLRVLAELEAGQEPFEALLDRMQLHTGQPELADDLTLCCLQMVSADAPEAMPDMIPEWAPVGPADWHCVYELRDQTLAEFNPLPLLLHICMEVSGLRSRSGEVYTLLSELYSNALEHGVLALSSEWKTSPGGFSRYYQARSRRLSNTDGHFIRFSLKHQPRAGGGTLTIVCEDSGDGFDFTEYSDTVEHQQVPPAGRYAGRGLEILRRMARNLKVHGQGNRVEIVYDW